VITYYRVKVEHDNDSSYNPREDCDNLGTMFCWHRKYRLGDCESDRRRPSGERARNPKCELLRDDPETTALVMIAEFDTRFEPRLEEWHDAEYKKRNILKKQDKEFDKALRELHDDRRALIQRKVEKLYVVLPLYLYDHSGITMNTTGFSCGWDSGQVGFIWMSRKTANAELGYPEFAVKTGWTAEKEKRVVELLRSEVKTYDDYITGSVYHRRVEKIVYEFETPVEEVDVDDDDLPWTEVDACGGFLGDDAEASGLADGVEPFLEAVLKEAQGDLDTWKLYVHEPEGAVTNG
jgi:hypothetical protein